MSCGVESEGQNVFNSLTADRTFEIPSIDLAQAIYELPAATTDAMYQKVEPLTADDLTTRTVGGSGIFDAMMASVSAHLKEQFDKGRITGAEYTKAYIELTQAAMASSVQFVLNKDQSFWEAQKAQVAAITGRVAMAQAKAETVKSMYDAQQSKAAYGLTKAKIATESIAYCLAVFQHEKILPAQQRLLIEQAEVQRAQTGDERIDGSPVLGLVSKQKALYTQQIDSYKRDAENKAVKLFTDAWITQKTIDEGITPPSNFTNSTLDTVLDKIRVNNGLV